MIATDRGFVGVGGYDYAESGDAFYVRDAMVYDAASDSWSLTTKSWDPDAPRFQSTVWYGNGRLYEWGGRKADVPRGQPDVFYRSGYVHDFTSKQWSRFEGGPKARYNTISAWTGEEALIYGGEWIPPPEGIKTVHTDGAIYRP